MHTNTPPESQPSCADAPNWQEEWVSLDAICQMPSMQVRKKLDKRAIASYRSMTSAGSTPPLIKVACVPAARGAERERLVLVDGWHRMEAGALITEGALVRALVASMSEDDARWEAAQANMHHGVQLKPSERRAVFAAYVKAGKHRTRDGYKSWRTMASELMQPHSTLRTWMRKDFRGIYARMRGDEGDQPGGLGDGVRSPSPVDEVRGDLRRTGVNALSLGPADQGLVARDLETLLAKLKPTAWMPHEEF